MNRAKAGRSTRTFVSEQRWQQVDSLLKPGDFLLMQFGHNEGSVPDTTKAGRRGVLRGTGNETKELGHHETVHTYGWYLRQFVRGAKAKGAKPIIASMIPRNEWKDGKVVLADQDFGRWAAEVARQEGVPFIDLNGLTAAQYNHLGSEKVSSFFPGDYTHTNADGARLNAASVVDDIRDPRFFSQSRVRLPATGAGAVMPVIDHGQVVPRPHGVGHALSGFSTDADAYQHLMHGLMNILTESINLVRQNEKLIYVDGGFARNPLFMQLLGQNFPEAKKPYVRGVASHRPGRPHSPGTG
ncbi:rhamnogalacturonan acetylesterase [Hymenobacter sp. NBH84]|uniref:rhamnogalacturonan acetylesterase n=1 Tax=Hymenobacter sp. NBH84 TaxID=2596915 RepID=UPI0021564C4C|nr:rhamnogalacturonan acetylesterase [Hymenobacter sp. NBH84]